MAECLPSSGVSTSTLVSAHLSRPSCRSISSTRPLFSTPHTLGGRRRLAENMIFSRTARVPVTVSSYTTWWIVNFNGIAHSFSPILLSSAYLLWSYNCNYFYFKNIRSYFTFQIERFGFKLNVVPCGAWGGGGHVSVLPLFYTHLKICLSIRTQQFYAAMNLRDAPWWHVSYTPHGRVHVKYTVLW